MGKFATVTLGNDASVLAQFAPWLQAKTPWDAATMGPKPTADQLRQALQTQSGRKQKGTGTVMVRALLFRKDGATKSQRDAVMGIQGRGSCENDGAYGTLRKAQWSGESNDADPKGRNVTVGTAIVHMYPMGRSHWRTELVKAAETTAPKTKATADAKATGKAKTPAKGKTKAKASKPAKTPVKTSGKAKAKTPAKTAPKAKAKAPANGNGKATQTPEPAAKAA